MLYDDIEDPRSTSPEQLRADYAAELADQIESEGVDAVADESGVNRETVATIAAGEAETVQLEDAAAIQATAPDAPPADDILLEVRDELLMGMTTAVLDVDTIGAEMESELDGKQIQQKIEGREPMTLAEFARIRHFIASRQR